MATPASLLRRPKLGRYDRIRIAVRAGCDERTVERYLEGHAVFDSTRRRIERALVKASYAALLHAPPAAAAEEAPARAADADDEEPPPARTSASSPSSSGASLAAKGPK